MRLRSNLPSTPDAPRLAPDFNLQLTLCVHGPLLMECRSEGGKAESVLVPWMSLTPAYGVKGFRNTSTYYRAFCAAPRKGSAKPEGQPRGVEAGQEGRQLNLALGMAPSRPARFRLHEQGQDVELPLSQGARVSGPGDFFPVHTRGAPAPAPLAHNGARAPEASSLQSRKCSYWIHARLLSCTHVPWQGSAESSHSYTLVLPVMCAPASQCRCTA